MASILDLNLSLRASLRADGVSFPRPAEVAAFETTFINKIVKFPRSWTVQETFDSFSFYALNPSWDSGEFRIVSSTFGA